MRIAHTYLCSTLSEPPEKTVAVIPVKSHLQQRRRKCLIAAIHYRRTGVTGVMPENEALPLLLSASRGVSTRAWIEAVKTRAHYIPTIRQNHAMDGEDSSIVLCEQCVHSSLRPSLFAFHPDVTQFIAITRFNSTCLLELPCILVGFSPPTLLHTSNKQ